MLGLAKWLRSETALVAVAFAITMMFTLGVRAGEPPVKQAPAEATILEDIGGFFGGVWNGVVDAVTLKPFMASDEGKAIPKPSLTVEQVQIVPASAAYRTSSGPASRMMDRVGGLMDFKRTEENEFGLPK